MSFINPFSGTAAFFPKRKIGSFEATITLEESATDELEITQHPVQDGAAITDHAYKKPVSLSVKSQYSPILIGTPIDEMYRRLLVLQNNRIPMDVVTGKRLYKNMLIKTLAESTDKATSNVLNVSFTMQEIIVTSVVTVTVPATSSDRSKQDDPGRTGANENGGTKKAEKQPDQLKSKLLGGTGVSIFGGSP